MQNDDQEKRKEQASTSDELSAVWRELLGNLPGEGSDPSASAEIPTLESDPWRLLIDQQGIEVVDMQKSMLRITTSDLEHLLQQIEERPASGDEKSSSDEH
jgi:hypothetical protein